MASSPPESAAEREKRLQQALRQNLRRRKGQAHIPTGKEKKPSSGEAA